MVERLVGAVGRAVVVNVEIVKGFVEKIMVVVQEVVEMIRLMVVVVTLVVRAVIVVVFVALVVLTILLVVVVPSVLSRNADIYCSFGVEGSYSYSGSSAQCAYSAICGHCRTYSLLDPPKCIILF